MEYKIRTQPEEWACTKFCRIALDTDSVDNFTLWLCDHSREQIDETRASRARGEAVWYDPVESTWGWDAPRQRLAKMLWQALHGGASDELFRNHFTFGAGLGGVDCAGLLKPIQEKLKWVMEGLFSRNEQDSRLGQLDWGEQWWLSHEHAEFVRSQLLQTHVALIEQSSDYEDAMTWGLSSNVRYVVQAVPVPCHDSARTYRGIRQNPHGHVFAWVQGKSGEEFPLGHGDRSYHEDAGTGFEWGYGGHGPYELARCILIDALDGDLVMASDLAKGFLETFTYPLPHEKELDIPRPQIMQWLEKRGKKAEFEKRRKPVAARLAKYAPEVAEKEELLSRIRKVGGLRSQRFDIVPETFEAALYLDLMKMLEHGGFALRCSGCDLPIPYDRSGRANKQRARSRKGLTVYHPECFAEHSRLRKKADWKRRSQSPKFREKERRRARTYRKLPQ